MLSDIGDLPAIKLTDTDWLRFELDPLTPFGREIAMKELRETPEVKQKAIEDLRNLLQGEFETEKSDLPWKKTHSKFWMIFSCERREEKIGTAVNCEIYCITLTFKINLFHAGCEVHCFFFK